MAAPSEGVPPVGSPQPQQQPQQPETSASWLESTKLSECSSVLEEAGYTDTIDIVEADEEEIAEILAAVAGLKKPTQRKFKRELAKLRGKGETF